MSGLKADTNTDWVVEDFDTLLSALEITKKPKKLAKYHAFIVMIGTTEVVKYQRKIDDVFDGIKTLCTSLAPFEKPVYLLQTPPSYEKQYKIYTLNHLIGKTTSSDILTVLNIQVLFTLKKSEVIEPDRATLTSQGAKMITNIIIEHVVVPDANPSASVNESDSSDDDEENICKYVHEVPENRMKFVIGTNGDNIKKIQEETSTDINKVKWREDEKQCMGFLIVGPKSCVRKAKEEIDEVVHQRKRKICKYYTEGDCKNGSKCHFLHEKEGLKKRSTNIKF